MQRIPPWLLTSARIVVALVWLYEGLWLKVLHPAPHELAVVRGVTAGTTLSPYMLMTLIGLGETLLGIGVLSGLWFRFVAWFQGVLLVAMNTLGILFGRGSIDQPVGLVVHNLPLLLCIVLIGVCGPGDYALEWPRRKRMIP